MKKLTALALALIMVLSGAVTVFAGNPVYNPEHMDDDNFNIHHGILADETFVLGDANGDGETNAKDSAIL